MKYFILLFMLAPLVRLSAQDFTPDWSKKVVWYQIFPERFRNGDSSNDPKLKDIAGSYPEDTTSKWQIHPWTSDWYALAPYEKENGKDIFYNIERRRYGGDLQGIISELDYLKDLGIGAIYLNPVFASPSSHKYDGASYHHIDPNFGPDPEGDLALIAKEKPMDSRNWVWTKADILFLRLINEVHRRGMKIIIDGVFNHMGVKSFAFQDLLKNQQNSAYKKWFKVISFKDSAKGTEFQYKGWFGVKELPELAQDSSGLKEGPKDYIFKSTRRWMAPDGIVSNGIDGWRLDVAYLIGHGFWRDWRCLVKSINPEAYMTAEIVDSPEANKPYLKGDEFDAVMNYNFAFAATEFFVNDSSGIKPSVFSKRLETLREAYPECVSYSMQNLLDSHDTHRIASFIVNRDLGHFRDWGRFFGKSQASNEKYITRKPNAAELEIQRLIVLFQMTYLGSPMVYYGDEAGLWGANDPCCRKPMLWPDKKYDAEAYNANGQKKKDSDSVEFNSELYSYYRKLIGIRNANPALQTGKYETIVADDSSNIFAFRRSLNGSEIIVVINNDNKPRRLRLNVASRRYRDLIKSGTFRAKKGIILLNLNGKSGLILKP